MSLAATPYNNNGTHDVEPRGRQVVIRRRGIGASPGTGNVGIGIKFTEDNGEHIVTSLLPEGPADMTRQVMQGDRMVAVDGVALSGKSSNEVIDLILGPPGADLVLTLQSGEYDREEILSPAFQQTPGGPDSHAANGFTPDLRSIDSPPSKEFELVSPGQMREGGSFPGASPVSRECSIGITFAMDKKQRVKVHDVHLGSVRAQCCCKVHSKCQSA